MPPETEVIEETITETPTQTEQPAPEAQPEAAPEQTATPAPAAKPEGTKEPHMVPYGALKEERERAERRLEAQRKEERQRFDTLLQRFVESRQAPAQSEPAAPQVDVDGQPIEALKLTRAELAEMRAKLAKFEEGATQQTQQQTEHAEFVNRYTRAAAEFEAESPDFRAAYDHWVKAELAELGDAGFGPAEANAILANKERTLALRAFNDGANPAQRIYAIAKRRGYSVPQQTNGAGNGAAQPTNQQQARPMPTETDKLAAIERGAQNSRSMSSGSGGAPARGLTFDSLAKMSVEEISKVPPHEFERVMNDYHKKIFPAAG